MALLLDDYGATLGANIANIASLFDDYGAILRAK